jgi:hypothetical protein
VFGIYYNYLTKQTHIELSDDTVIIDYAFITTLFDAILHYNVDTIEGYSYYSLGEYRVLEEDDKGNLKPSFDVEPKYLYLPVNNPIETDNILTSILVNYFDATIMIDMFKKDKSVYTSISLDKNKKQTVGIKVYVDENEDKLVIIKGPIDSIKEDVTIKDISDSNGISIITIPINSITNYPLETMYYNGFVIKPYRISKFIPIGHKDYIVNSISVRIKVNTYVRYFILKPGEKDNFNYNNILYTLAFGGKGVYVWSELHNVDKKNRKNNTLVTKPELVLPLKDLINNKKEFKYSDIKVTVVNFDYDTITKNNEE